MTAIADHAGAFVASLSSGAGVGPSTVFAAALLVGAAHALMPGHGKAMLAVHQARLDAGRAAVPAAVVDGLTLAAARVTSAVVLVTLGFGLARAAGLHLSPGAVQAVAGAVLVCLGAATVLRSVPQAVPGVAGGFASDAPAPRGLRAPILVLALTPEPLALTIALLAATDPGGIAIFALPGLALGMGATLAAAAALALGLGAGRRNAALHRLAPPLTGAVVVAAGLAVLAAAGG